MDREKVIKGLECCCTHIVGRNCGNCPYEIEQREWESINDCTTFLAYDALALLKEQEAVEPTLIREGRNKYYSYYVCPRCDDEVVYDQNYCSECGVRFLWEGR